MFIVYKFDAVPQDACPSVYPRYRRLFLRLNCFEALPSSVSAILNHHPKPSNAYTTAVAVAVASACLRIATSPAVSVKMPTRRETGITQPFLPTYPR